MTATTVRLEPAVAALLDELARRSHRSKSAVVNEALRRLHAEAELAASRDRDTMQGLDDVDSGRLVDGATVLAWLRSWGTPGELPPPRLSP